eukprot:625136_1
MTMSSLHKTIRFRETVSKLNNKEFNIFVKKISESYNQRDVLTMSLFHLLLYQTKQNDTAMVDNLNSTIKAIIDSRTNNKSKKTSETATATCSNTSAFNTCASSLISLISSYLHLSEYIQFISVDRNIYISVSSTLTSITTIKRDLWPYRYKHNYGFSSFQRDHQIYNMKRFKMVQNIELATHAMINLQNEDNHPQCLHCLWPHLQTLTLRLIDLPADQTVMDTMQTLTFNHLKLCRINMHGCGSFTPLVQFIYDMISCGMTQLSLYDLILDPASMATSNYDMLRTRRCLQSLCLYQVSASFNHNVISVIGEDLESLHVISDEVNEILPNEDTKTYGKLKELCVYNVHWKCIEYVLEHANQLKRLHLSALDWGDAQWRCIALPLMETQLEYVAIEIPSLNVMTMFVGALVCHHYVKRNAFKLRLNFEMDDTIARYLTMNLTQILRVLGENMEDFSFILGASWVEGTFWMFEQYVQMDLMKHYDVRVAIRTDSEEERFIQHVTISNRCCSMCAFNEPWIMDCDNCQQFNN